MFGKKMLIFLFFHAWVAVAAAQNADAFLKKHLRSWEKELQSKHQYWARSRTIATAPQHKTVSVLYINGEAVAMLRDATACRMEIGSLRLMAERFYDRMYSDYKRMGGKTSSSDHRMRREFINTVANGCSCTTENNPHYRPTTALHNPALVNAIPNTGNNIIQESINNNTTQITGNIFEAPSARTLPVVETPPKQLSSEPTEHAGNMTFSNLGDYLPSATKEKPARSFVVDDIDKLTVNIPQDEPYLPELDDSGIKAEVERKNKLRDEPFAMESIAFRKKALDAEYDEILKICSKSMSDACYNQLKPIINKLNLLKALMEGGGIELIDKAIEKNQEAAQRESFENDAPWENMSKSVDNARRLTTVMNQLVQLNSGSMPKYIGETGNAYHFKDEKNGTLFFVDKDGACIEFAKGQIQNPLKIEAGLTVGKVAGVKLKNGDPSFSATVPFETKVKGEIDTKEKVKVELSEEAKVLIDKPENEEEIKNWEYIKVELATKPIANLELSKVNIFDNGDAVKTTGTIEAGKLKAEGKLDKTRVKGGLKIDLASANGTISYIQSPTVELEKESFTMKQEEFGISVGIGASVGYETSFGVDKKGITGGALVKVGVVLQKHNTDRNINYLPNDVQKTTVYDLFRESL